MALKAHYQLKRNIDALLQARNLKRKDLAQWCHRTEAWLSQIFSDDERNMPLKYLDRIASFFKLETYQLFQPGLIPATERRSGKDRRTGEDRRFSAADDVLYEAPSMAALESRMRALTPREYRQFARRVEAALTLAARSKDSTDQPDPLGSSETPPETPTDRSARTRPPRRRDPDDRPSTRLRKGKSAVNENG